MNNAPLTLGTPPAGTRQERRRHALRHLPKLALAVGAAGLLACEEPDGGTGDPVIGHIPAWGFADMTHRPQVPDTVTAGVGFEVVFWTWGGGCMENGHTASAVSGRSAEVTPYDLLTWGPDLACTADHRYYRHEANLVFRNPGTAEITLRYSTAQGWRPDDFDGDGRKAYAVVVSPPE